MRPQGNIANMPMEYFYGAPAYLQWMAMTQQHADIYSFIGSRIRQERQARGFTLEELASAVCMNTSFLHYIEKNKKKPSLGMVQRIAEALNVSIEMLFRGAPTKAQPETVLAQKVGFMLRDATAKKRTMILRVIKTLAKEK